MCNGFVYGVFVCNLFTDPEFDVDYLLNPKNHDEIRKNIADRKGVGDIDLVVSCLDQDFLS